METIFSTDRKIRMGIWGLGRGRAFLEQCRLLNIEIVAGCDYSESLRNDFQKLCPEAFITKNEAEFLACDMDAVLVATYFFAHAEDSIKALKAGKHVLSEVSAFFTPAEGVRLAEAVEQSGKIYCLAENYTNHFVKKLWHEGVFGELTYGEIDYVHECRGLSYSMLFGEPLVPGNTAHSWRSWLNYHYYCTHSLGSAMETTGTRPIRICAPPSSKNLPGYLPGSEMGAMEPSFVTMDNGGIIRDLTGASTADSHEHRRFWGSRAFVDFSGPEPIVSLGQKGRGPRIKLTPPKDKLTLLAQNAGHSGGDFWVLYHFANAILNAVPLYWDIYAACDVTLAGIMAVKSQHSGGIPVDVPDFRKKEVREQYRNDHFAQKHFDPRKIFPDDQDLNETKYFSNLIYDLDNAWSCKGVSLIISVLDGIKLYPYIQDAESKVAIQTKIRELLLILPALANSLKQAKRLAEKYPDSLAGKALREYYDSAYPEKMEHPEALRKELLDFLQWADLPPHPQLRMYLSAEKIAQASVLPVPEGFTLRTFEEKDADAYVQLMKSAGFDYWNPDFVDMVRRNMLPDGVFFLEEKVSGKLVATAMANKAESGKETDGGQLGWVGVAPEFRGRHLAEIVCSAVVDCYRKNGYTRAYLLTDDYRIPAIKTYLKSGWLPIIKDEALQHRWDMVYKRLI